MEMSLAWAIAQRELRESLRNKWLWFYAAAFTALALGLSQAGQASAGYASLGGFGRRLDAANNFPAVELGKDMQQIVRELLPS